MEFSVNHKIVQIDGGLGRVLCAEPALRKLSEKYSVTVLTSWVDLFHNHPSIHKTYQLGREYLFDDIIQYGDFICPEPYASHFYYKQKHHLINSFNYQLNQSDEIQRPKIYLTLQERKQAQFRIEELKQALGNDRPIIALQTFGSSATIENDEVQDPTFRSLSGAMTLKLVDEFKDVIFINCSHIPIDRPNVANPRFSTRELVAVIELVDAAVTVDSFLAHVAYSLEKTTFQILGPTFKENISYPEFTIFQKRGYPRSYQSNRINGCLEKNQEAMFFTSDETEEILSGIRNILQNKSSASPLQVTSSCNQFGIGSSTSLKICGEVG
jgi:hypothetical protein